MSEVAPNQARESNGQLWQHPGFWMFVLANLTALCILIAFPSWYVEELAYFKWPSTIGSTVGAVILLVWILRTLTKLKSN